MAKKGLGRGLQALIPSSDLGESSVLEIKLDLITFNPKQPRRRFDQEKLEELSDSIKIHGVIQPIVVRRKGTKKFEIIAGERRFRATKNAGLKTIPVIIKDCSDAQMAEIALIENIQREDLDPIEEAIAYRTLLEVHSFTHETLSERLGKSRPAVTNMLRLLTLPDKAQVYVSEGKLTVGHAKVLLGIEDAAVQMLAVEKVVRNGSSVRETETLVKSIQERLLEVQSGKIKLKRAHMDPMIAQIEDRLRTLLRTQVRVKNLGDKGKIEIEYYNKDELSFIVEALLGELS